MLIACNNRGCLNQSSALLDKDTGEVVCQECGEVIKGISDFMKRTLKDAGQVIRTNVKRAYMVGCSSCKANREPVYNEDNKIVCKVCHNPINLTPQFFLAMEETGHKLERLKSTVEKKTTRKKRTTKKKVVSETETKDEESK